MLNGRDDYSDGLLAEMERLYSRLGLGEFAIALPWVERYVATHGHSGGSRPELAPETANAVLHAWRRMFDKYGYSATTSPA